MEQPLEPQKINVIVPEDLREIFVETFGVSINPASGNINIQMYSEFVGNPTHFHWGTNSMRSVPAPSENLTRRMVGKVIISPRRALELADLLNNMAGELKMLIDRQGLSNN